MRIIAGSARRTPLFSLKGEDVRPTLERVKEGLFSAVQFEINGGRVLDLFAGTGQLGLEALSRGAAYAVFVDEASDAIEVIRKNAEKTGLLERCKILRRDYSEYLKSVSGKERFDFVLLDPPYSRNMQGEILKKVARADILAHGAWIVCETDGDTVGAQPLYGLTLYKKYRYGRTWITILQAADQQSVHEGEE